MLRGLTSAERTVSIYLSLGPDFHELLLMPASLALVLYGFYMNAQECRSMQKHISNP